jgi:DNA-binding IclR family transcriptional regulator
LTELRTAKELSYCVQAGEFLLNEINLAAPVLNASQTPVAAVVVSRLYREEEKERIVKELAPPLLQTVKELSGALGSRF